MCSAWVFYERLHLSYTISFRFRVSNVCIVRLHSVITIVYSRYIFRCNNREYECIFLKYPCVTPTSYCLAPAPERTLRVQARVSLLLLTYHAYQGCLPAAILTRVITTLYSKSIHQLVDWLTDWLTLSSVTCPSYSLPCRRLSAPFLVGVIHILLSRCLLLLYLLKLAIASLWCSQIWRRGNVWRFLTLCPSKTQVWKLLSINHWWTPPVESSTSGYTCVARVWPPTGGYLSWCSNYFILTNAFQTAI